MHASDRGRRDRRAPGRRPIRRGGGAGDDAYRRTGANRGVARRRRRRSGVGGDARQDVAPTRPPLVVDRRAHPHQCATGEGAGGHGCGAGTEHDRRFGPGAGERPAGGDRAVAGRAAGERRCEGRLGRLEHVPPGQGTAMADRDRPRAEYRPYADRLRADARRGRGGAPTALRRPHPGRRGTLVQLVREHRWRGTAAEPMARAD